MTDAAELQETDPLLNQTPWREVYGVHPAAELFPPLTRAELEELAADLKQRGMLMPVLARRRDDPGTGPEFEIVDGRSRLDAMTLAGLPLFDSEDGPAGPRIVAKFPMTLLADDADPYAAAISANIRRRHLSPGQRRDAIAKVLAARPEQSDRQVAKAFGVDHTTVGAVRRKAEATGGIPPVASALRRTAPTVV